VGFGEVAGDLDEFVGEGRVGQGAECFGAAFGERVGVTEGLEGVGDLADGGVEPDHVACGGAGPDQGGAVLVGASDPDAAGAGAGFGGGAGSVGIGGPQGGVDDRLEADRGDGVDDRGDLAVHDRGGLFGQGQAGGGDLAGLPRGGVSGQDLCPGAG
jgi:hypothetical protein